MHRIDTDGANGIFTDGNPATGQLGTRFDAAYWQDLQENICHAIEASNIALAKGDATQLYAAMLAIATGVAGAGAGPGSTPTTRKLTVGGLLAGGGDLTADRTFTVPKASIADVALGTRDDAAVTPAGLAGAFTSTPGAFGSCLLPGGTIFKWGGLTALAAEGLFTVTFPVAFPTACDRVLLTTINATGSTNRDIWPEIVSKAPDSFTGLYNYVQAGGSNSVDGVDWFAIGR